MTLSNYDLAPMMLAIADLHPHPGNARRGNVQVIAESLDQNGQFRTVLVNLGTRTGRPMEIIAGHHLVQAAQQLGWTDIKCSIIDVDDYRATRILLADNRTTDLATYDDQALLDMLRTLPDLDGTGYLPEDMAALEAVLRDHSWEDEVIQDVLDKGDKEGWPEVKCRLPPPAHERFIAVLDEGDDADRIMLLVERFWA